MFERRRVDYAALTHTSVFCEALQICLESTKNPGKAKYPRRQDVAKCATACTKSFVSAARSRTNSDPGRAVGTAATAGVVLERVAVKDALSRYTLQGVADSTRRAYASGQRPSGRFCEQVCLLGLPASERVLCIVSAALAREEIHRLSSFGSLNNNMLAVAAANTTREVT